MDKRSSYDILFNSRQRIYLIANEFDLVISKAEVSEGLAMKASKPRVRGCSFTIKRPTCRIAIVVKDI